jgi:hypothetical protein
MVLQGIMFAINGSSQMAEAFANMPPEQLDTLRQAGIDPSALGIGAVFGVGAACCLIGILIAAALGAAGGYYWGNSHQS